MGAASQALIPVPTEQPGSPPMLLWGGGVLAGQCGPLLAARAAISVSWGSSCPSGPCGLSPSPLVCQTGVGWDQFSSSDLLIQGSWEAVAAPLRSEMIRWVRDSRILCFQSFRDLGFCGVKTPLSVPFMCIYLE